MSGEFTREVRFRASYDHRDDTEAKRGAGGVVISFILGGSLGAISADISTGWMSRPYLGTTPAIYAPRPLRPRGTSPGVDLNIGHQSLHSSGVHSHCTEQRREWWSGPQDCILLNGPCYGDTGYMVGDQFLEALVSGGDEAAWQWLEECYQDWLGPEDAS